MSNICKTVSLRTRKIKDGHMLSYYLDYYPGYRVHIPEHTRSLSGSLLGYKTIP